LSRKKVINILKWVWLLAVLAFAGWYLVTHFQEIRENLKAVSAERLVLSVFLLFIGKFFLSDLTRLSLKKVNWKMEYTDALSVTSVTQLGKYLPGGIWHFAGKFGVYKARGLSAVDATRAMVLENIWLFSSATAVGISALLFSASDLFCDQFGVLCGPEYQFAAGIGVLFLWVIGLFVVEKFVNKKSKFSLIDFILVLAELVSIWVLFGVSFFMVFPPGGGFLSEVIGAFGLSWIAGYAAFFAPGGIGIREALLALILGAFFAGEMVAVRAAIHRLIWVLVEIILGLGCILVFGMPIVEAPES